MKIVFAHVRNYANSGDMASCPYQYFKDFFNQFECKFLDISDALPYEENIVGKDDCVIVGGGGLDGYHDTWQKRINSLAKRAKISIGWGFGSNRNPKRSNPITVSIDYDAFTLVGTRDYKENKGRYLPCVSCMHPAFKKEYKKVREIGFVMHRDSIIDASNIPTYAKIATNSMGITRLMEFIGSSKTIESNSYHVCYWASLFNVPVKRYAFDNNDSRFNNAKFKLEGNNDGFLQECIDLNTKFFNEVKTILKG